LKLKEEIELDKKYTEVLYIHPIKQGLKPVIYYYLPHIRYCSLHTSNKTRIETVDSTAASIATIIVLYIHPIKQGLKLRQNIWSQ